jgi:LuxR family maltose regulon positive regulatory protein
MRARVWIAMGELGEARAWARAEGLGVDDEPTYLREYELVTLARLLLAEHGAGRGDGSLDDARALLDRLAEAAESGGRLGSAVEILVVQALAHEAASDLEAALASLGRALEIAEPEGFVRVFLDEGEPMAALLKQAAARDISKDYAAQLLARFDGQARPAARSTAAAQPLAEPISSRELEVLRLLADGLSNDQIAKRLFVALSTIKGHNMRIFNKLGVRRRTEAVARARELGLL